MNTNVQIFPVNNIVACKVFFILKTTHSNGNKHIMYYDGQSDFVFDTATPMLWVA